MWYLLEAIFYGLLIVLQICFWPALIIGGSALILQLAGKAVRSLKENDDKEDKKK